MTSETSLAPTICQKIDDITTVTFSDATAMTGSAKDPVISKQKEYRMRQIYFIVIIRNN